MTNPSIPLPSKEHSKQKNNLFKDCINFLSLVGLIYLCYIVSAVYHQKILKYAYINPSTGQTSYFEQAIVFTLFPQLFGTIVGYIYKFCLQNQKNLSQNERTQKRSIPWKNALICGLVCNFNMFTYNQAVVEASFPAVVMVKSCSLLSVILVGVFCSRVKDKNLKLRSNKIIIGIIACIGIFIFNFFKQSEKGGVDKPISLMSSLLLIASLIGDGFLPDLQAEIKSQYKPSVMEMYLEINKFTFLVALIFSVVTFKIFYFIDFFLTHDEIFRDIVILSVLNSLGQIVIYKMIRLYKQHIPAFVIGIRKCLTVVVNILYFGHTINKPQLLAIIFVFSSIMWETYDNYLQKKQKEKAASLKNSQTTQIQMISLDEQIKREQNDTNRFMDQTIETNSPVTGQEQSQSLKQQIK